MKAQRDALRKGLEGEVERLKREAGYENYAAERARPRPSLRIREKARVREEIAARLLALLNSLAGAKS